MVPPARWLVVALLALAVASPPTLLRLRPVKDTDVDATTLARQVLESTSTGWSGEVRSRGSLELPLGQSTFGGMARILGEDTHLRVWWRDSRHWRIDRLRTTGETDVLREDNVTIRYVHESLTARLVTYSPIREPDDHDVVPTALAARMLARAGAAELSRLPPRRVAGRSALGLRLVPASTTSTIARVDVWTDRSSRVPLRVDVFGDDDTSSPAMTSEVVAFEPGGPTDREVSFEFSPEVDFQRGTSLDAVASANAFAPFLLPSRLIGLRRHGSERGLGAVGAYGRGVTALLAVPLRGNVAHELRHQLARNRAARVAANSVALEVGPLSVLLVEGDRGNFLLTGTITPEALRQASIELQRDAVRTR